MDGTLLTFFGLFALLYVALTAQVLRLRITHHQSLGDGGHAPLTRAIRAHANFNEYVPLILLLLWVSASHGASLTLLHVFAQVLFIARISHAYSILVDEPRHNRAWPYFRSAGMIGTLTVLILLAANLIRMGLTT